MCEMKNIFLACLMAVLGGNAHSQSPATAKQLSAARSYLAATDIVYPYIDSKPMYPGGEAKWESYVDNTGIIQKAINEARKQHIAAGTYQVVVRFEVKADGTLGASKIVSKPVGYGLEDAALKIVRESGKWTPANIEGQNAKAFVQLPLRFTISY
jgi:TonB family protein